MSKKCKIFIALIVAAIIIKEEIFTLIVLNVILIPFAYKFIKEAAEHG